MGSSIDSSKERQSNISEEILLLYDVYSYRHAASILKNSFPIELAEVEAALLKFKITTDDIAKPGGNESVIPKKISSILRPLQWHETRIQGDLIIKVIKQKNPLALSDTTLKAREVVIKNYIDGHKIDYVKNKVALEIEWNSKDQTFDRDLYAFRTFHECGVISVAILITRSEELDRIFNKLPLLKKDGSVDKDKDGIPKMCKQKYGASTTWIGKLLYRLNAGRHGGCPVLISKGQGINLRL